MSRVERRRRLRAVELPRPSRRGSRGGPSLPRFFAVATPRAAAAAGAAPNEARRRLRGVVSRGAACE